MWGYMQTNKMLLLLIFESTMYIEYWRKDASQFSFIYLKSHILHLIANLPHIYYVHFRNKYHTHRKIVTKSFLQDTFSWLYISHIIDLWEDFHFYFYFSWLYLTKQILVLFSMFPQLFLSDFSSNFPGCISHHHPRLISIWGRFFIL